MSALKLIVFEANAALSFDLRGHGHFPMVLIASVLSIASRSAQLAGKRQAAERARAERQESLARPLATTTRATKKSPSSPRRVSCAPDVARNRIHAARKLSRSNVPSVRSEAITL